MKVSKVVGHTAYRLLAWDDGATTLNIEEPARVPMICDTGHDPVHWRGYPDVCWMCGCRGRIDRLDRFAPGGAANMWGSDQQDVGYTSAGRAVSTRRPSGSSGHEPRSRPVSTPAPASAGGGRAGERQQDGR